MIMQHANLQTVTCMFYKLIPLNVAKVLLNDAGAILWNSLPTMMRDVLL